MIRIVGHATSNRQWFYDWESWMPLAVVTGAARYVDLTGCMDVRAAASAFWDLSKGFGIDNLVLTRPLAACVQTIAHE